MRIIDPLEDVTAGGCERAGQGRGIEREPPPRPAYDLIACRNVVIYFARDAQERLFQVFVNALAPGGVLLLGKVETLFGPARERLTLVDPRERIYVQANEPPPRSPSPR